ncbi:MAG: farnesyl diphosphate synthase [Woeseiaceae bacterium]|nr:farnesyl diphosphate synthase [Woeseiaceae bacterium]
MTAPFADRVDEYVERIGKRLDAVLPGSGETPQRLHEAMRYAVLNGGKRIRPLLAYASAECLDVPPARVDAAAIAIELLHAFSLVHDDLPAMDDDDLRRGQPTVHRRFDEATAILAADALQPLAFTAIAWSDELDATQVAALIRLIGTACGSRGMTGGQSIDLSAEGRVLVREELEHMYALKTGALIHAAVMSAACVCDDVTALQLAGLERFGRAIGLAFQVRDDMLDIEGETDVIGKPAGSDVARNKATWPVLFGMEAARDRCNELLAEGLAGLDVFGERAAPLRWLARFVVERPA